MNKSSFKYFLWQNLYPPLWVLILTYIWLDISIEFWFQSEGYAAYHMQKWFQEKIDGKLSDAQDEMKSKIDQIITSVEKIKNAPKAVIAFRATCAKNFPNSFSTRKKGLNSLMINFTITNAKTNSIENQK